MVTRTYNQPQDFCQQYERTTTRKKENKKITYHQITSWSDVPPHFSPQLIEILLTQAGQKTNESMQEFTRVQILALVSPETLMCSCRVLCAPKAFLSAEI